MNHKQHFVALDGLRGVAALCVVIYHFSLNTHGYLAVDFFFMLSGFVIAYSYEDRLIRQTMSFMDFLKRRFIRLYPMIFLGMVLGTLEYVLSTILSPHKSVFNAAFVALIIKGFLLIPNLEYANDINGLKGLVDDGLFPINGPLWSMFFEIAVNIMYAITVRKLSLNTLVVFLILNLALIVPCVLQYETLDFGHLPDDFLPGLLRTLFSFSIGIIIFRLRAKLARISFVPVMLLSVILAAVIMYPYIITSNTSSYDLITVILIFPLIIIGAINCNPQRIMKKLCKLGGDISYPLYMIHLSIIQVLQRVVFHFTRHTPDSVYFTAATTILCIVAAYASLKLYDEKVRLYLTNKIYSGRKQAI